MGVHGSRSRSRSRSRSPKRQRRDRSASPRRSRSPGRRRSSRSHSRSRSPHGFGRGGTSPSRGAAGPFGRLPGGIGTGGRPSAAALAAMGPGGGGITPPPWVTNARLAPQVKSVLEALYTRGKLGPGDLEYACVEFLELLGPVAGMAVLEEFASLDFFRIRNLTAFFIGICKRVQNRAPPPPGRPVRGPDGGSPPPAGSMMRGRTLHRGPGGGGSGGQAAPSCSGGAGGTGLGASALQHGHSRLSRSPGGPGTRRASPPLHFNMEDGSRSRSPPIQRRWVSKSPPPRRFNSKSPPLQRRWVSRSPAARRAGSKSPPPRRWVSKSPPPRRWVSRSPPSRRFTSKSPPSRRWVSKSPPKRTGSKSPPTHSGQHRRSRHSRSPPPPPKPQRSPSPPGRDGSVSNHDASGTHTTAAMQSLPPPPSLGQQQPRATHSNASTGSRTSAPGAGPVNVTSVAPAVSASGCASASAATRPTVCEASHGHDTAAAPEAHARGEGGAGHAPGGSSTGIAAGVAVEGGQAAGSFRQPIVPVAAAAANAVLLHDEEAGKDGGLHEPKGSAHEAGGGVVCSAAVPPLLSLPLDGAAGVAEPAGGIHFSQPARAAAQEQEAGGFAVATTAAAAMVQAPTLQGEQQEPHQQHYAHIAEHHENGTAWPEAHTLSPAAARGRASSGPAEGLQQGTHDVGDGVLTVDLDALFNNGALLDHRLAASAAAALQVASSTNIHGAAVAAAAAAGDMLAAVLAASTNGLVGMALAAPLGGWTASEAAIWDAQRTPVSGSDRENSLGGMAGAPGISNYAKVPPPLLAGTSVVLDIGGQHTSAQGTQACPAGGLLGGVLSEALSSFGAGGAGACPHGGGGALRQAVTEHVKEVLKPAWRANKLTRETFKAVAKKAVDGVLATLPNNGIGSVYDTPVAVASFFSEARREVIGRLVEGVLANLAAGELQE